MSVQIEPFQDSSSARAELVPFLMAQFTGEGACDEAKWLRRLSFWWDENPFAHAHTCRGWLLRDLGRIVGYLGAIPTLYEDAQGHPVPALIATSWAVEEPYRHAALPMGLMLQRLGKDTLLVDTTPSPEVQALLARWGWQSRMRIHRGLLLRGAAGGMMAGVMSYEPPMPRDGREIVTDLERVSSVSPARPHKCVQKHITRDYLRWYLSSPMREHHFVGVVAEGGMLTSCIVVAMRAVKGIPTWKVVDWFTTEEGWHEIHALVSWLMDHTPAEHGRWWPFISLASFPEDEVWQGLPLTYSRAERICHHHWLPPALNAMRVRPVMAEGDWGL